MDIPLTAWTLFGHAGSNYRDVPIVSAQGDGTVERATYADLWDDAQRLMNGLDALDLPRDATVATLAWNSRRHLAAYFGVPCTGRVLHTLNLRLSPEELGSIVDDAGDDAILVDADLLPLLARARTAGALRSVRHIVVLGGDGSSADIPGLVPYDELLAAQSPVYEPTPIDERSPLGICYTSGTTGRAKGVVYTHRSTVLHALAAATGSGFSLGPSDCALPVVPMFHANAWGLPYAATMVGAKQVFLAGSLDAGTLIDLLQAERVTVTAGVPTVWLDVADELARRQATLPDLRHIVCGGARPPAALVDRFRRDFGIPLLQAWGMTETSPLASVAWPKHAMRDFDDTQLRERVATQAGLPLPTVGLAIRSDNSDDDLPWDGASMGRLLVRGPYVVDSYLHGAGSEQFEDGWFVTGDVAIGTPDGYFHIADRSKDLVKSGGEWISSVDMESAIMAMPEVCEAAVIAVPDPRWLERPLACIRVQPDATVRLADVHRHLLSCGFAKWQLPDRVEVVEAIPRTSVGKFDKLALRARFAETEVSA